MNDQGRYWDRFSALPPSASVIDRRDRRGHKNRYIAQLRNQSILDALGPSATGIVLDFGCGTGGLSTALVDSGRKVVGLDISMGLLRRTTELDLRERALFVCYNGSTLPLGDSSLQAAATYLVLQHILDDRQLLQSLLGIHRALQPGGRLVAMEQIRQKRCVDHSAWLCRRTIDEYMAIFAQAGFCVQEHAILRYGRFPGIIAARLGWVPASAYPLLQRVERWIGRRIGTVAWDYCDVLFSMTRE